MLDQRADFKRGRGYVIALPLDPDSSSAMPSHSGGIIGFRLPYIDELAMNLPEMLRDRIY
ncbi:hypothetical protein EAH74_12640 [Pseudomonas mandelii]|uniref:Uncharacterized protein n=1 Tax=Pseudomonas mandelii TaxID=75612 RepID=A0A502ICL1_9PSED|nr:hypothetical protein EAH74_12640 [Pseudomonas mandelii]